jgi:hypothetical protein
MSGRCRARKRRAVCGMSATSDSLTPRKSSLPRVPGDPLGGARAVSCHAVQGRRFRLAMGLGIN